MAQVVSSVASNVALAVSALLPPPEDAFKEYLSPPDPLPSPTCATLGPLPPTTPIHLALSYLTLSDIPDYDTSTAHRNQSTSLEDEEKTISVPKPPARVLVITGNMEWMLDIEDEDEDYLREKAITYSMVQKLKRVDIRYCQSPEHLLLLLSLLSIDSAKTAECVPSAPASIILWDIGRLFMEVIEKDENLPPGIDETDIPDQSENKAKEEFKFRAGATISDYLNLISAARGCLQHFSSVSSDWKPSWIILEPNLDGFSSLPILKPASMIQEKGKMGTPTREKRVNIKDALGKILGSINVGLIEEDAPDPDGDAEDGSNFTLTFPTHNEKYQMRKRRCPRGEWARATPNAEEGEEVEADKGGWRWEWI